MNSFFYKSKGAISIFLLLVLVPMMTLGAVLIDGTRKMSADQIVQGAADSAAMSVLADFDSILKSEFGLFALENPQNASSDFENYFKKSLMASYADDPGYTEMAWQFLKNKLLNKENLANMNFYNFYDFQIENAQATPMYSLANTEVLENQLVEYMKYRAPVEIVKSTDILGVFDQAKQLGDVKGSMDLLKKKNKFDKKKMKLQSAVVDLILVLDSINEFNDNVVKQWRTNDFGRMYNIKYYDTMANHAEEEEDRKYYKERRNEEKQWFKEDIAAHLIFVNDKIELSDIKKNGELDKKIEKIKEEVGHLKDEATKLKNEITPYASKDGMEGDTAKEILKEVEAVLQLSGYEEELNQKLYEASEKHDAMVKYRDAYKKFMQPMPNIVNEHTNIDGDIMDGPRIVEVGLRDEYDRQVTPFHKDAVVQLDTSFPPGLQFGSQKDMSENRKSELKNYKSNQSPDSDYSKAKLESEKEGKNKKLQDLGIWDTLPSRSALNEPDFSAFNEADKAFVDSRIQELTNDISNVTENEDILGKLKDIDFDDEKSNGFFSKVSNKFKEFFNWISGKENIEEEKTAFDDVASISDTLFKGVGNLVEGVRDQVYVNTYASSRFKSRLTVDPSTLPKVSTEDTNDKHIVNWRYAEQPVNGTQTLVGALDLRNRPKFQNKSAFENGELEYILIGNQSEAWNENQVYAYIYGLRLANNIVAVYLNSTVNTVCLEAATAVAGWWTFGVGIPVMHWAFMMAVASAETFIEMDFLVNKGYKIPLIKHGKNLNLCPPDADAFEIGSDGATLEPYFQEVDFGVCYEDFLSIFMLMLVDKNTKLKRIADLIQMDYRQITGKGDFNLNQAYTYIRVDSDASIDFKFIPAFDLGGVASGYNGRMHNRNIIYHGY